MWLVERYQESESEIDLWNNQLKTKSNWTIRLDSLEWAQHTYERSAEDPLQLLGSARCGLQSGALAKLGNEFVLMVRNHVTTLSHADNRDLAAETAHTRTDDQPFVFLPTPVRATLPVFVVIECRRVPAIH